MSHLRFDGRVAIVTVAGSALGQRHAVLLAERGAKVLVNDADPAEAARVVRVVEARGGAAVANSDVVGTPEGAQAIVDAAVDQFGWLDIVVHQSGQPSDPGSSDAVLGDVEPVELLSGLFGGFWLAHAAWVHMRERRYGRIVLTCSFDRALDQGTDDGDTVASLGLVGLMNILKVEGPVLDMKVNMVAPTEAGDLVAATDLTAYLAHEECATVGEIFTVQADGLARLFIGVNTGIFETALSADSVRDRLDEIMNPDTFIVPDEASGEITLLLRDLGLG
jgi:NAD(P)-dependent dehydrogenase (short-subunit alcohol dehydrogenase family)